MNFSDVVRDVHKLIGLELDSISRGAPITVESIDDERDRLIVKPQNGNSRSRPMDELKRIWDAMQKEPAVHVDKVLNGSGTSRNQPETILANLPYIEWLRIGNKKHIAYVGKNTHPFGTLQEMDPMKVVEISAAFKSASKNEKISAVISTKDVNSCISIAQGICSGQLSTIEQGVYQIETNTDILVFVSSEATGLEEGTYCIIESYIYNTRAAEKRILLYGHSYSVLCNGNIKMLIRETN